MESIILNYEHLMYWWVQVEGELFVFYMFKSKFIHQGMDQTNVPTIKCTHIYRVGQN